MSSNVKQVMDLVMYNMEKFPGIVVLNVTSPKLLSLCIHHFDPEFIRKFKFLIQFSLPSPDERAKLWNGMIPPSCPCEKDIDFLDIGRKFAFTPGLVERSCCFLYKFLVLMFMKIIFYTILLRICMYPNLSRLYIYIYIYMCVCVCVCVVYIYIGQISAVIYRASAQAALRTADKQFLVCLS